MATEFTPIASLLGGMLIGLSAVILMAANGRIAGVSGILTRLLDFKLGGISERPGLFFIFGLIAAPVVYATLFGGWPEQTVSRNFALMAAAGLFVGFGSAFGNGCTSGHGVCGLSRLSTRSLVATCTFMAIAAATVFVTRHLI
ncbi:MAG: YeeE/YedE family protein [Aliishimia sp.]